MKRLLIKINLGITAEDMLGFLKDKKLKERDLQPYKYLI